ncbi:MAG: pyruvate kinase, partial [Verrucomicrobiaceae bacterium]
MHRTKVVVTLGPASSSPEIIRHLVVAGMNVARLNFSHGSHEEHARQISILREISEELDTPVTILQDLQGPKIRVGQLPAGDMKLVRGTAVSLVPEEDFSGLDDEIPLDYAHVAANARPGMRVLLDDGLLGLEIVEVAGRTVRCQVVEGGVLKSRKGVNFPDLTLPLPSL